MPMRHFTIKRWIPIVVIECEQCRLSTADRIITVNARGDIENRGPDVHSLILAGEIPVSCPRCGATYQFLAFNLDGNKVFPHLLGIDILNTLRAPTDEEKEQTIPKKDTDWRSKS